MFDLRVTLKYSLIQKLYLSKFKTKVPKIDTIFLHSRTHVPSINAKVKS